MTPHFKSSLPPEWKLQSNTGPIDHVQTAVLLPKLLFTDSHALRDRAFAKLWLAFGKAFAEDIPPAFEKLPSSSRGVILDVGPGAGHHTFRFDKSENITMIYGAEPCTGLHPELREHAVAVGLSEKYRILSCGVELEQLIPVLAKDGLIGENKENNAVFDEIICIRVLCGVPDAENTIRGMYSLLKPGGRLVVCEHVINSGSGCNGGTTLGSFFQKMYMWLGWSFWIGACDLRRDTMKSLVKVAEKDGGWAKTDVQLCDAWSGAPHIVGSLIKKD
jgi:SAM-dependent methyltransferase